MEVIESDGDMAKDMMGIAASSLESTVSQVREDGFNCHHYKFRTLHRKATATRVTFLQSCRTCGRIRSVTVACNYDSYRIYGQIVKGWLD